MNRFLLLMLPVVSLFACQTTQTEAVRRQRVQEDTMRQQRLQQILNHCHRTGAMDTKRIDFVAEPACVRALTAAKQDLERIYFCENLSPPQSPAVQVRCILGWPEAFAVYHSGVPHRPVRTEPFYQQCHIAQERGVEVTNDIHKLRFETQDELLDPLCKQEIERAFTEDWPGLLSHRCYLSEEKFLFCEGEKLPPELAYYATEEAKLDTLLWKLPRLCHPEQPTTPRSLRFAPDRTCQKILMQVLALGRPRMQGMDGPPCVLQESKVPHKALELYCGGALPETFLQAFLGRSRVKLPQPPTIEQACAPVGAVTSNTVRFLPETAPLCSTALRYKIEEDPTFQERQCRLEPASPQDCKGYILRNTVAAAGAHLLVESATCQAAGEWQLRCTAPAGLPEALHILKTSAKVDLAYETNLATQCSLLGKPQKKSLFLEDGMLCESAFREVFAYAWNPLAQASCKLHPSTYQGKTVLRLQCRKAIPVLLLDAFSQKRLEKAPIS